MSRPGSDGDAALDAFLRMAGRGSRPIAGPPVPGMTRRCLLHGLLAWPAVPLGALLSPVGTAAATEVAPAGAFVALTRNEAAVVDAVAGLLVPGDDRPGAREAGVARMIDRTLDAAPDRLRLYRAGVRWLDDAAADLFDAAGYLTLDDGRQKELLVLAEGAAPPRGGAANWRRVVSLEARQFFVTARDDVLDAFYSSPTGWEVLGYDGPPQWGGYPDYDRCP